MSWYDEQFPQDDSELRNWATEDDPEGNLTGQYEKGAHLFSAIAKILGLGKALEGNWAGAPEGTHSPMWGRGSGSETGWIGDKIPYPIAKEDVPIVNILGAVPYPAKGAMEATGIIPTARAAAKSRAALAASPVEAYAEVGRNLQNAPGIGENVLGLVKEGANRLLGKVSGLDAGFGLAPDFATANPALAAQRSIMHEVLGKHDVVIPYIPKSSREPLMLKAAHGETVDHLTDYLPGLKTPDFELQPAKSYSGLYYPLWEDPTRPYPPGVRPREGTSILATVGKQRTTVPHETTHKKIDDLTGIYHKGNAPIENEIEANASFGWPIRERVREQMGDWDPLQYGKYWSDESTAKPGLLAEKSAQKGWWTLEDKYRDNMRAQWPDYGWDDRRMAQELVAELANPEALALRLNHRLDDVVRFKNELSDQYPELKRFWSWSNESIHPNAYDVPLWQKEMLARVGQGTSRTATSLPDNYRMDSNTGRWYELEEGMPGWTGH